jgi:hypothetical protein
MTRFWIGLGLVATVEFWNAFKIRSNWIVAGLLVAFVILVWRKNRFNRQVVSGRLRRWRRRRIRQLAWRATVMPDQDGWAERKLQGYVRENTHRKGA